MEGKKTRVSRETTIDIEGYPNSQGQGKKGSVGNNPSHRSGHSRSIDPNTIYSTCRGRYSSEAWNCTVFMLGYIEFDT